MTLRSESDRSSRRFSLLARFAGIARRTLSARPHARGNARATTWHVDASNPNAPGAGTIADPYTKIGYAVSRPTTVNGDELEDAPDTCVAAFNTAFEGVHIVGTAGTLATILQGPAGNSQLQLSGASTPQLVIEGLTIRGFHDSSALAIATRESAFRHLRDHGQRVGIGARDDLRRDR